MLRLILLSRFGTWKTRTSSTSCKALRHQRMVLGLFLLMFRFFCSFVTVWQYNFFEIAFLVETSENEVRIQVRDSEMWKSAKFELRTTKTARKSGAAEFPPQNPWWPGLSIIGGLIHTDSPLMCNVVRLFWWSSMEKSAILFVKLMEIR